MSLSGSARHKVGGEGGCADSWQNNRARREVGKGRWVCGRFRMQTKKKQAGTSWERNNALQMTTADHETIKRRTNDETMCGRVIL